MDKKKLKLSISGNTKKTITNIEKARSNPKNTFIVNKNKQFQKKKFHKLNPVGEGFSKVRSKIDLKKPSQSLFPKKDISDFEKESWPNKEQQKD